MTAAYQTGDIFEKKYELMNRLGTGGLGTVFKARQLDCDRILALKILHLPESQDSEFYSRFLREAQLLNQLSHANIVTIYNVGLTESEKIPYLALEWVQGISIRQLLNNCDRLATLRALRITRDCAKALSYVHSHGIIHRDIKPDNVLLVDQPLADTVKLIDFGLARPESPVSGQLTKTGLLIGTVEYMSPEQCMGRKASHAADLYSLCICLYEMLTGRIPYTADSPIGLLYKHINDPIPEIKPEDVERYHPNLNKIMKSGLAKTEEARYSSAEQVISDLNETIEQLESSNISFANQHTYRKKTLLVMAASAILTTLLLGLLFLQYDSQNPQSLVRQARRLPVEQAQALLCGKLESWLKSGREKESIQALDTYLYLEKYSPNDRSEFSFKCFELWKNNSKQNSSISQIAIEALYDAVKLARDSLQKTDSVPASTLERIKILSHYLSSNTPSDKDWIRLYQIGQERLSTEKVSSTKVVSLLYDETLLFLLAEATLRNSSQDRVDEAKDYLLAAARLSCLHDHWETGAGYANEIIKHSSGDPYYQAVSHMVLCSSFAARHDEASAQAELAKAESVVKEISDQEILRDVYHQALYFSAKSGDRLLYSYLEKKYSSLCSANQNSSSPEISASRNKRILP